MARKDPPSSPTKPTKPTKPTGASAAKPTGAAAAKPTGAAAPKGSAGISGRTRSTDPSVRRARVAEVKKAQRSRERRTVLLIVAACSVLVLLLAGVIAYGIVDARRNLPDNLILTIGSPAASASCDPVTTDEASGNSDHVGAGTNKTGIKKVQYSTVPPTSGSHFVQPVLDGRQFYTKDDTPAVETLVHNLEHGYTVLWYVPSAQGLDLDQLKQLATVGNKLTPSQGKFIVAPWNDAYGQFPEGKYYALSHWSAVTDPAGTVQSQSGHRMLCGQLSGEAVKAFVTQFPKTDAPEPLGA